MPRLGVASFDLERVVQGVDVAIATGVIEFESITSDSLIALPRVTAEAKGATAGAEAGWRRLDPFLRPRSVVVVGASPNPSFVSAIFKNLLRNGYTGSVAVMMIALLGV